MLAVVAPPGLQEYAGLLALVVAVSNVATAPQFVAEFTPTVGTGCTVIVPLPLFAQPVVPSVTVTV